jgi:hypothetical protein
MRERGNELEGMGFLFGMVKKFWNLKVVILYNLWMTKNH